MSAVPAFDPRPRETRYRPHPFSWSPGEGRRHAIGEARPPGGWPDGTEITALCGDGIRTDNSTFAWFWPTCPDCNVKAHHLARSPMAPGNRAASS
ncbi:zinc finger protein [Saccharopolyspora tripterygii]